MVHLTYDELETLMASKHKVRNISVIGHCGHGKTTLVESLKTAAVSFAPVANNVRRPNAPTDEADHDITTMSTGTYLQFKMPNSKKRHLITIMDTPGHGELSSEVTAALRITDGALIVVDCIEGFCLHSEMAVRLALCERIKPVLSINKIDRFFLESDDGEAFYMSLKNIVDNANNIIRTYQDPLLGDVKVDPLDGTVAFASSIYGWAFKLSDFAKIYAVMNKTHESEFMRLLWGEIYFDTVTEAWTHKKTGASCIHGFVHLCYTPIKNVINLCLERKISDLWNMMEPFGVTLGVDCIDLSGEELMIYVMQKLLPLESLIEMMISNLPSPHDAQEYRAQMLYTPPQGGESYAHAIINCDPNGPMMLYISKMIPTSDKRSLVGLGRIFSGAISQGFEVNIVGPDRNNPDVHEGVISMVQKLQNIPCGNIVALDGLDKSITKNATLIERGVSCDHRINRMRFSVTSVLRVTVHVQGVSGYRKLAEGLELLNKLDPMVVCTQDDDRRIVFIAGAGEVHLRECTRFLKEWMGTRKIEVSEPCVSYRESINESLDCEMIMCTRGLQFEMMASPLVKDGVCCFGPGDEDANMTFNIGKGLEEIFHHVAAGFMLGSENGKLAKEKMCGISFKVCSVVHKGDEGEGNCRVGDASPEDIRLAAKEAFLESQLRAKPRLLEPVYLYEILVTQKEKGKVYQILKNRGVLVADVHQEDHVPGVPYVHIKCFISVKQSVGLAKALRSENAFSQYVMNHWCTIDEESTNIILGDIERFKQVSTQ